MSNAVVARALAGGVQPPPAPLAGELDELAGLSGVERVVIIGAGLAGLGTALALKNSGKSVVILERDDEPPAMDPGHAFVEWTRPGVPQFHHTHIFLSRLRTILRDRHPEVLDDLARAGIERSTIDQVLPLSLCDHHVPAPDDDDFLHLWGRRATLEYVLRKHVGRLANVRFLNRARVEGLAVESRKDGLAVRGVRVRRDGETFVVAADVVVDASGVRSRASEWLRARGARIRTQITESPCTYYCRHYRQLDPTTEPPRRGTGASLDYLVYGTFFAEDGTFSIAFAIPESEPTLSQLIRRPEGFQQVCSRIPALERWTSRSEPISRVLGGADLANRWNHHLEEGPPVLGFFPVGDSHIQTNPVFGRGCSQALVQAEILASVLKSENDPARRARRFHRQVRKDLKPHFDFSVAADRAMTARARLARGETLTVLERLMSFVYERIVTPAIEEDRVVAREWLKVQQMREVSPPWVGLYMVLRVIGLWIITTLRGRRAPTFVHGPTRAALLNGLALEGLEPTVAASRVAEPATSARATG